MKQNTIGTTGIKSSRAGFGVLALGRTHKVLPDLEGAEILLHALKRGIRFFDTAQYYEEYSLMRRFINLTIERGYSREDIVICSKSLAIDYEGMSAAINEALSEMGLEYIDIFLMHEVRSGKLDERKGAWKALMDAKVSGKVRAIGVSTHHVDVVFKAAESAVSRSMSMDGTGGEFNYEAVKCTLPGESSDRETSEGIMRPLAIEEDPNSKDTLIKGCDCIMAILNIEGMGIRRGEAGGPGGRLPGYWIDDRAGARNEMEEALKACHDAGLGVITMKALGGGNLAASYVEALDYSFGVSFTDCVLLGMSSSEEVDVLADYLAGSLDIDYKPDLMSKVLKVNHDDCVGCGQCMEACASDAIFFAEDGLVEIDIERCIDCGYCAYACPVRAIIKV